MTASTHFLGGDCIARLQDRHAASRGNKADFAVTPADRKEFAHFLLRDHYAGRVPPISYAFGLYDRGRIVGVCTFGVPGSRHLQKSLCPSDPSLVLELNRLWVSDGVQARNIESWFLARCLKYLPPRIVVSYADTAHGHYGYVYRAANFNYAGWSDMERKTPRYDYIAPGKHSRDAFRNGAGVAAKKVRRKPKVKYWITTGTKRERKALDGICAWPRLSWIDAPPPAHHVHAPHLLRAANDNDRANPAGRRVERVTSESADPADPFHGLPLFDAGAVR